MAEDKKSDPTMVTTGKVRISYAHLLKPRPLDSDEVDSGKKPAYGCMILIPKSDKKTVREIRDAIEAAKEKDKAVWGGKIPNALKLTLRDGDEEAEDSDDPKNGHWFMNVSTIRKPGIVNGRMEPLTEEDEVYSGMYARVNIRAYGYHMKGNKGVTFALNHVQKMADGEFLGGGRTKVEDVFDEIEDEDELDDLL